MTPPEKNLLSWTLWDLIFALKIGNNFTLLIYNKSRAYYHYSLYFWSKTLMKWRKTSNYVNINYKSYKTVNLAGKY